MVQRRHGAGFAHKASAHLFSLGNMFGQDLNCDGAFEARIAGLIDLAHAARAEGREDFVGSELLAGIPSFAAPFFSSAGQLTTTPSGCEPATGVNSRKRFPSGATS